MNRMEFLTELERLLSGMPEEERQESLSSIPLQQELPMILKKRRI